MSTSPIAQGSSATNGLEVVVVGAGFAGDDEDRLAGTGGLADA